MTFHVAEPRPAIGNSADRGSGINTASPCTPLAMSALSCWPRPHGASCRSCATSMIAPAVRAPVSRSTYRASTAAASPPFMSEAPLPVSFPSTTSGGTNGKCTVSKWPSNCKVRPGRPLSKRTTTAGEAECPATGRSTANPSPRSSSARQSAASPAWPVGLGTATSRRAVSNRRCAGPRRVTGRCRRIATCLCPRRGEGVRNSLRHRYSLPVPHITPGRHASKVWWQVATIISIGTQTARARGLASESPCPRRTGKIPCIS